MKIFLKSQVELSCNKDACFNTNRNSIFLKSADSMDEVLRENTFEDQIDYESYFDFDSKLTSFNNEEIRNVIRKSIGVKLNYHNDSYANKPIILNKKQNNDNSIKNERLHSFRKIFHSKSKSKDNQFKLVKVPEPMRLSKVSYKSIQYSSIPSDSIISSDVKLNSSLNLPENAKLTPIKHDIVEDIYNFIQPKKISRTPQYYNIYRLKRRKPFSIFGVKL